MLTPITAAEVSTVLTEHHENAPLLAAIQAGVREVLAKASDIPGLTPVQFAELREGIQERLDILVEKNILKVSGPDKDVRPYFVGLQNACEHAIAHQLGKTVKSMDVIIHTPMPATPFCTKGEISPGLVVASIANDPARAYTVQARPITLRNCLYLGAKFYIAYPKEGISGRTEPQQQIYKEELANYAGKLIDLPLNCESMENDLIGATYFFTDFQDKTYAFGIQIPQANDPKEEGDFGLWLGPISHPDISERTKTIIDFVQKNTESSLPAFSP